MTRRRLRAGRGLPTGTRSRAHAVRPSLAGWAGSAAARGRGLGSLGRLYLAAGALLLVAIAYLAMAAQATQSSYELSRLREQGRQLQAEQDQLRFQAASLHTPARVEAAAAQAGLQRTKPAGFPAYQPVAVDLGAPTGPERPERTPPWQRALAAVIAPGGRDALAKER